MDTITEGKQKTLLLLIIVVIMFSFPLQAMGASVCTVMGYISYENGTPAESGTLVRIADISLGTVYETETGGKSWPYPNFYVQSFTCNYGTDRIAVVHGSGDTVTREDFVFDHYPYEVNLSIPAVEKDNVGAAKDSGSSEGSGNAGKGSGSGAGGGPGSWDFGTVINESKINRIPIGGAIRLYIINDSLNIRMVIGNVTRAGEDSIRIAFNTLDRDVLLRINEPVTLDLDNDGSDDTKAELTRLDDDTASVRFDKIPIVPDKSRPSESSQSLAQNKTAHEEEPYDYSKNRKNIALGIMGCILLLLLIIIIAEDKKARKRR